MSSNVIGLRIMDVVIGRVGGWPGEVSWTDPTKAYIRSPYVFDYGLPSGPISYINLPPVPLPSNTSNAAVYVTLQDVFKDGQAAVFADLTQTRWNDPAFVKVGVVIPGCSVVPWDAPVMGASGANHSPGIAPDPGSSAGTTHFLREDATWAVPAGGGSGTVTHTAGALTAHAVVVGNGGSDEKVLASLGTSTTVLHGNASGDPPFGPVVEADLSLTDVTTANVSTSAHGFAPKAPNDATKFLDGTGAYSAPTIPVVSVNNHFLAVGDGAGNLNTSTVEVLSTGVFILFDGGGTFKLRWQSSNGLFDVYGNTTSSGPSMGFPWHVQALVDQEGLTASLAAQTLVTTGGSTGVPGGSGIYEVKFVAWTVAAGTGTTATVTIRWNDGAASKSFTSAPFSLAATDNTGVVSGNIPIAAGLSTTITVEVNVVSIGTSSYNVTAQAFQLSFK